MEISRHRGLPGGRAVLGGVLMAVAVVGRVPRLRAGRRAPERRDRRGDPGHPRWARCSRPTDLRTVDGELPGGTAALRRRRRAGRSRRCWARSAKARSCRPDRSPTVRRRAGVHEVAVTLPRRQIAVGRLKEGERVDVFVTYDERTASVVRGAQVVQIGAEDDGSLTSDREISLVVAVPSGEAVAALVHALRTGDVTVVRSTFAEASVDDPLAFEGSGGTTTTVDEAGDGRRPVRRARRRAGPVAVVPGGGSLGDLRDAAGRVREGDVGRGGAGPPPVRARLLRAARRRLARRASTATWSSWRARAAARCSSSTAGGRRGSGVSWAPPPCWPAPSPATSCSRCCSRWRRRSPVPPATSAAAHDRDPPHRLPWPARGRHRCRRAPGAPRSPPRWPRAWPAIPATPTWCASPTSRCTPTRRCSTAHPTSCPGSPSWSRATGPALRRSTTCAASRGTSRRGATHLLLGPAPAPRLDGGAATGLRRRAGRAAARVPDRGGGRRRRPRGRAGHRVGRRRGAQRHRSHHDLGRRPGARRRPTRAEGTAQPPAQPRGPSSPTGCPATRLLPVINRSPKGPRARAELTAVVRRAAGRRRRRRAEPAAPARAPPPRRGPPRRRPVPRRLARTGGDERPGGPRSRGGAGRRSAAPVLEPVRPGSLGRWTDDEDPIDA